MKRILITGGSGFIGTNLIKRLLEQKHEVINVDKEDSPLGIKTVKIDLADTDFSFLDGLEFDYVVHLAALSNPRMCADMDAAFETNVNAMFKMFSKLAKRKLKKAIFMSSIVVYSDNAKLPINELSELDIYHDNYCFTKGLCEDICELFRRKEKMPIITFRLSNIYGPHQGTVKFPNLVPQLMLQAMQKKKLEVWNKDPIRDWVYVKDAVEAIIAALDSDYNGTMNLGTGIGTSVGDVAKTLSEISGAELGFLNKPASPPLKVVCDISRIKKELNWSPKTSVKEGIRETYEYYKKVIK